VAGTIEIAERPHRAVTNKRGRDLELVHFVGRHGVVAIAHVMATLNVSRASAYRRVAACIERGLLARLDLLRAEPSLLTPTREGLRYAGLGLPVPFVSPGSVDHWLRCASTAQLLAEEFGAEAILTERELAHLERIEGRPIASAKLGELPNGYPRLHRPDLAVAVPAGILSVEVELTAKGPHRLAQLLRAWRRSSWVSEVRYYCDPAARRAVERAISKTRTESRICLHRAVPRLREAPR
jgi:hypothetical protein